MRTSLLGLMILTLLFFSLSLMSLVRQQESVQQLSMSNLRSNGERVALEVEREVELLARICLGAGELKNIRYTPGDEQSPQRLQELRRQFAELGRKHPIARSFFILYGNRLVFPAVASPAPMNVEALLRAGTPRVARQFETLMKDAEEEVSGVGGRIENAVKLFRRAEDLDVPARLKALAAFRAARGIETTSGPVASIPAFQKLIQLYGDQYDENQIPYRLVMIFAPSELASRVLLPYPQTMRQMYRDLLASRWELSADQTEKCLVRIEELLGMTPDSRGSSQIVEQIVLARAASTEFQNHPASLSVLSAPRGFRLGDKSYQTYYSLLPGSRDQDVWVGLFISAPWVEKAILPECLAQFGGGANLTAHVRDSAPDNGASPEAGILIPFRTALSAWSLEIPAQLVHGDEAAANRELWFIGMAAGMFLSVLGLGAFLLSRVSRDLQWFQVRSDFVSGVSHELKTPLSLIRLYSETLADNDQNYPPEERHSYIRIIARESERLSRLIDNILDFSKIEQGRKRYMLQEGDLAATVKQTVDDYSEYLALRGFAVKVGIQPHLPPVRFSREQISQVVLNLLDNARKYSGKSRLIRVHMWWEESRVVLEIQDYGVGIPEKEREKIFQPFYRVPGAGEKGGCGLGLYLVRHVMDGHGGSIEVLSEVGKGSRFRLSFPAGAAAPMSYRDPESWEREDSLIQTG